MKAKSIGGMWQPWLVMIGVIVALAGRVRAGGVNWMDGRDDAVWGGQVPSWSREDLQFFLNGSLGTEFVPEVVLRAFVGAYPEMFANGNLAAFGLIVDGVAELPVGVSRRRVPHLGRLNSVGINCAACHVAEMRVVGHSEPVRILGATSHFDPEAFLGSVIAATFKTADPENLRRFLVEYLKASDREATAAEVSKLELELGRQEGAWKGVLAADAFGSEGIEAGALHDISPGDLRLDREVMERGVALERLVRALTRLFHNMRVALHFPDRPPSASPPPSGPGRNDAFGLLAASLLGESRPTAPVKFGPAWNLSERLWVHWDGNTRSPVFRNLAAALGLGAPMVGRRAVLDFGVVQRHTDLSERIRSPRFPLPIDRESASRGAGHFKVHCASCHTGPEGDQRLFAASEVGTDPARAESVGEKQAEAFNRIFSEVELAGYVPPRPTPLRSTGKYWSPGLAGVWARAPYLHNGSVRTLRQLLMPPALRERTHRRGSREYDPVDLGYADGGSYVVNASTSGSANTGHEYGTGLSDREKTELIEYLKTL